jgi:hypothetical protein
MNQLTPLPKEKHDEFLACVTKWDWLHIAENKIPTGTQDLYITPSGEIVGALYNSNKEFLGVGRPPVPVVAVNIPQTQPVMLDPNKLRFQG